MPYSPAQVVATAYQLVLQKGLFNDDCKVWKRNTDAYKTWANFKVDFAIAYQEWWESKSASANGAGFQSANLAISKTQLTPLQFLPSQPPETAPPLLLSRRQKTHLA